MSFVFNMEYINDDPSNGDPIYIEEKNVLGRKKYSELLIENINRQKDKSITIGLFGEWGTGKSSIVGTAKEDLKKSHSEIKFITYDAWKYTNDGFRRTFLIQIFNDLNFETNVLKKLENYLKFKPDELKNLKSRLYSNVIKPEYHRGAIFLVAIIIFFILIFAVLKFYDVAIIASTILVLEFVFKILLKPNTNIQTPQYFSPEQFENDFEIMVGKFTENSNKKIVIVIDNIDRCSQEQAYQTLSDIKGFLDNKKYPVVFLIPVDDTALANKIKERGDNPSEFFRKIFDLVIYVKPLKTTELHAFAQQLNETKSWGLEQETIYILSEAYATNPRRIVQLVNNLQIELTFFDKHIGTQEKYEKVENGTCKMISFSKRFEKAICKLLIIREEWPDFYQEISRKPELLRCGLEVKRWDSSTSSESEIEADRIQDPRRQKLIEFLKNTRSITESEDDTLLSQLMTVKNPFEMIPPDILNNISKRIYENKITDYILENENNFTLLATHIINELETEIRKSQYELMTTVGSNPIIAKNFDHLLKINEIKNIEKFDEKIQNIIENFILSFITDLEELSCLVRYAYELNERGKSYLYKKNIVRMLNVPEHGTTIGGFFYVNLFLAFVNELNVSCCWEVRSGFAKKYEEILGFGYLFESEEKISLEKINNLISDPLIDLLIKRTGFTSVETSVLSNLKYIISTNGITDNQITQLAAMSAVFFMDRGQEENERRDQDKRIEYYEFIKEVNNFFVSEKKIELSKLNLTFKNNTPS